MANMDELYQDTFSHQIPTILLYNSNQPLCTSANVGTNTPNAIIFFNHRPLSIKQ